MSVPVVTYGQIESWLGQGFWPFVRIGACLMVAPLFGATYVPPRIRIVRMWASLLRYPVHSSQSGFAALL